MRVDLFLKASRLCPRRTIAQKLCEAGFVLIGEKAAKASHTIKPGDEITIKWRERVTKIRVRELPANRQTSRKQADELYEKLSEEAAP